MNALQLPPGPFNLVLADPPWRYNDRPRTGTRFGGGAEEQYLDHDGDGKSTMSIAEMKAMPVGDIVADDAWLFMWCTWPTMWASAENNAFAIVEAWGFRYVTLGLLWVKTNPAQRVAGNLHFGQGFYAKSNSEPCLLAVRGKPWLKFGKTDAVSQILAAPGRWSPPEIWAPISEHSEKPDEARVKILEFCGEDIPRVELFSRHPQGHRGFTMFGNEVGKLVPEGCKCCAHLRQDLFNTESRPSEARIYEASDLFGEVPA